MCLMTKNIYKYFVLTQFNIVLQKTWRQCQGYVCSQSHITVHGTQVTLSNRVHHRTCPLLQNEQPLQREAGRHTNGTPKALRVATGQYFVNESQVSESTHPIDSQLHVPAFGWVLTCVMNAVILYRSVHFSTDAFVTLVAISQKYISEVNTKKKCCF